jgi:hypothetical protein
MTQETYRAALDAAVREYERAYADRAALDVRLAELQQSISTLTRLCGFVPSVAFGLTDACRLVLRGAGAPMTAVQVRERLLSIGFDLDKYENALAAIHTVLKRLAESGETHPIELDDSRSVAYAFVTGRTFQQHQHQHHHYPEPATSGKKKKGSRGER